MSWGDTFGNTWFGRIMRGIIKLGIATAIFAMLTAVTNAIDLSNVSIGGNYVNLQVIIDVIKVFAPIALIISALHDMGIKL